MAKSISVCLSFDFDAMSAWIGSFGATSPSVISRGEFGKVGTLRLLELLGRYRLPSTWFIPGHTVDTFPELVEKVAAAGHEVGHHGYCHENPATLPLEEERGVLEKGIESIRRVIGKSPQGYRSPAWDTSPFTLNLLLEYGFFYDSSMMANDFTPYYCRMGDKITKDGPYGFGKEVELVELPVTWGLDDFPPFEFVIRSNPGLSSPSQVYEIWSGDFDYLYQRLGEGVYTLTMHPQVIGRGHRLLMLEKLIEYIRGHSGIKFRTMGEVAAEWKQNHPFGR
jgi:peptidoglycan/xylan/chitin deacetylase (PgdA/CDA1 family)